ncbi:REP-associated tyrosine transposase [Pseudoxanthomonas mexicana]|uniref:REP-associated tyrosine transposase n=1 Tax=Pseudoxanthomonas mexicana TaxID=128785 RepID=UPI00398AD2A8
MDAMAGYRELRKGRASMAGQVYLVTFATAARSPIFSRFEIASEACRAMTQPRLWYGSRLLAWVLMPDHWHGLVELGPLDDLSIVVQKLKSNSARSIRTAHPEVGSVWAKGFHDRAIRSQNALRPAARYIVANPLRADLAERVGDYPYWNSVWL